MTQPQHSYSIGPVLGRGAVAAVHAVTDAEGHRFAAKILHASRDGDEAAARRFEQEANLLEGLAHANIVRVYGMAQGRETGGRVIDFLRMELVEGEGLDVLIAKHAPLPQDQVIEFATQLAEGLACAHGQGIVHRDLKPANVLVGDEEGRRVLKIADFGMARASSLSGVDPSALTVLGTPDYMAPESIDPLAVDARTDLYALGCMIFEMLTGRVPFAAATPFGVLQRHRDDPVPTLDPGVSAGLRALVQSLLAKSPADRPPSAGAVSSRLRQLSSGQQGALVPVGTIGSSCAGCGQVLIEDLAVCMNCGLPCVTLESGKFSVLIIGPGEVGDKIEAKLREALVNWMVASPHLGLTGKKSIDKKIPRLPILFTKGVSQRTALAMVASLSALGLEAEAHEGGVLKHPLVRKKVRKLSGRVMLIVVGSMGYMAQHGAAILAVLGLGGIGGVVATAISSSRAVTQQSGAGAKALAGPLRKALDAVEAAVPALGEARHRHGLRAVVRDALAMRKALGTGPGTDAELAGAIEGAAATSLTLARIDAQLKDIDLHRADDEARTLLHQRDVWSGRMLELAGALDRLRQRLASTQRKGTQLEDLDELRASVEALEEMQEL